MGLVLEKSAKANGLSTPGSFARHVEIRDQKSFGFVVRALGYGGLDFEDDTLETLAEAMVVLEAGLSKWFKEQGIQLN